MEPYCFLGRRWAEYVLATLNLIFKGTPIKKVLTCIRLSVKTKMAFLSRMLILLAILLHGQFIHHKQISL